MYVCASVIGMYGLSKISLAYFNRFISFNFAPFFLWSTLVQKQQQGAGGA